MAGALSRPWVLASPRQSRREAQWGSATPSHVSAFGTLRDGTLWIQQLRTIGMGRDYGRFTVPTRAVQDMERSGSSVDASQHKQLVEKVKQRLEKEHPNLPRGKYGRDDDKLLLWFLKNRKFDADQAVTKLANFIRWRQDFGVDKITDDSMRRISVSGKAYLHTSPDIEGRPVLVVVAARHFPVEDEAVDSQKLCVYLVEKALERLPPGGEQILGIFNLRGFTAKNGDLKFVKFLIDMFYNYYPKRLARVLFIDAPFIFQPGWSLVKPLLKSYASLVRFCPASVAREEYFTQETVPLDLED